jgi:hypothetical protein
LPFDAASPDVCINRSRTVISRVDSPAPYTFGRPSAGRYFTTGSLSWNNPSSYNCINPKLTIGLVIE